MKKKFEFTQDKVRLTTVVADDPRIETGAKEILEALEEVDNPLLVVLALRLAFTAYVTAIMRMPGNREAMRRIVGEIPNMILVPPGTDSVVGLTDPETPH